MQAASELAGWTRPYDSVGDGPAGEQLSTSGGCYPSALMQEARGKTPQGSVRRQQHQKLEPASTPGIAATAAAATTSRRFSNSPGNSDTDSLAAAAGSSEPESDGVAVPPEASPPSAGAVGDSKTHGGGAVGGTTRRWGYRRGPREKLRRNLFGRLAPVFFYPLAQVGSR